MRKTATLWVEAIELMYFKFEKQEDLDTEISTHNPPSNRYQDW
jgi:hypothetical protein